VSAHILEREHILSRPLEDVFAFFSEARNLAKLMPSSEVLTPQPSRCAREND
jgi:ligand-binding SRPBCC domain-containing protein